MSDKKTASEEFVHVNSSGAVSVELGRYLKSDAGQKQLKEVRTLRDYFKGSEHSAPQKGPRKTG